MQVCPIEMGRDPYTDGDETNVFWPGKVSKLQTLAERVLWLYSLVGEPFKRGNIVTSIMTYKLSGIKLSKILQGENCVQGPTFKQLGIILWFTPGEC